MATGSGDPLVPARTPYSYGVGINYETWEVGRTGYSIPADVGQTLKDFRLIRTYHDVATYDMARPTIDPTQKQLIDAIRGKAGVELVMGTLNSALFQGGAGNWTPGLMTSRTYTDAWVKMLVDAFGSRDHVKAHLKTILLANEIDINGPNPATEPAAFGRYMNDWIPAAFDNLKASLAKAGLGTIPVTTSLAAYGPGNQIANGIPAHFAENWPARWNGGEAFAMYNHYPPAGPTDFGDVIGYSNQAVRTVPNNDVYIGETGYSAFYGAGKQASIYQQMFRWLDGQHADGGHTIPLFAFMAFDRPNDGQPAERQFGIYETRPNGEPGGLEDHLAGLIPDWVDEPAGRPGKAADAVYGTAANETLAARGGDDIVMAGEGNDRVRAGRGDDLVFAGAGNDLLAGQKGDDSLRGDARLRGRGNGRGLPPRPAGDARGRRAGPHGVRGGLLPSSGRWRRPT